MILIDANALIILILGLINPKLIQKHKRTSIYEKEDFEILLSEIEDLERLVVLPNVWTEVDNLLNNYAGHYKYQYIKQLTKTIELTTEKFIKSIDAINSDGFYDLGLTDSLILEYSKECEVLITSDSSLSDYAIANGVKVFDLVKSRNERI